MLKSLASAFLMYSRIPVPNVEWNEKNHRYSLCFFPMIGMVTGGIFIFWNYICRWLNIGSFLFGAVAVLIPLTITGGIHMDGFCDVSDAIASYGDKNKRHEILKDPHIGSFAVIKSAVYLILQTALFSEIPESNNNIKTACIIACGFVVSRVLSAFGVICFKSAKSNSSLQSFIKPAYRRNSIIALSFTFTAISAFMIFCNAVTGICCLTASLLTFAYYRFFAYKNFGGITGDTAGWFLQVCEIIFPAVTVFCGKITEV